MVPAMGVMLITAVTVGGQIYTSFTCTHVAHAKTHVLEMWVGVLVFAGISTVWCIASLAEMRGPEFLLFLCAQV